MLADYVAVNIVLVVVIVLVERDGFGVAAAEQR